MSAVHARHSYDVLSTAGSFSRQPAHFCHFRCWGRSRHVTIGSWCPPLTS